MPNERRYKQPLTAVEKMRLMRIIIMVRAAIMDAAIEEEELGALTGSRAQFKYVATHRKVYNDKELHSQFPFLDIRTDSYASDLLKELEKDMIYYIKNGDAPGP